MMRLRRHSTQLNCMAGFFGLLAIGCQEGDFGRTRAGSHHDNMHEWLGQEATASVGETPSAYKLTDSERRLRDLAYPFIEPPRARPHWAGVFGDYQKYPAPWRQRPPFDITAYGRRLLGEPYRSQASRYARLIDDIRDDITRLDPFFGTAVTVIDLDAKRERGMAYVSALTPDERGNAVARMRENVLIVQWVQGCLEERISSYRWALERLVVSAPDPSVALAEQQLALLIQRVGDPRWARLGIRGRAISVGG